MKVHSSLGSGFLESVYQEALEKQFIKDKIPYKRHQKLNIVFNNEKLKKYFVADFVCYEKIVLELKAVSFLRKDDEKAVT
ncbi:MAG: GxxExxY protein [Bacteroidales bacterium]|nr:GxxExxY protein [Bacteroidales bacterium]